MSKIAYFFGLERATGVQDLVCYKFCQLDRTGSGPGSVTVDWQDFQIPQPYNHEHVAIPFVHQ